MLDSTIINTHFPHNTYTFEKNLFQSPQTYSAGWTHQGVTLFTHLKFWGPCKLGAILTFSVELSKNWSQKGKLKSLKLHALIKLNRFCSQTWHSSWKLDNLTTVQLDPGNNEERLLLPLLMPRYRIISIIIFRKSFQILEESDKETKKINCFNFENQDGWIKVLSSDFFLHKENEDL